MHLNIKSDKTYELAATAARLTGKSLTQTVTDALNASKPESIVSRIIITR